MVGEIYKNNYNSEKIALNFKGNSISYGQLDQMVLAYAGYLKKAGLKAGDKVVLSCINSPEFIYSYLGTVRNGAVIVPINLMLTMEEIIYIVKDSEAKFMIIHPVIMQKAKLDKETVERALGITLIVLGEDFNQSALEATAEELDDFSDENVISTFLYTSGTTGKQKAAMLTHKNLVFNSEQCFIGLEAREDDIYMCVLPMFHVFAFTACILMPLWSGATVTILESFQPKEVIEVLLKDEITIFMGVPAMYVVLLEAGKKNISFPKLRLAVSGGAALPVEIYRQSREIMKLPVVEGYGLTEASPAVSFNPPSGVQKEGSIGLPIPFVECKIVDENDAELPAGEVGELAVRGDNVMLGYYNQPEETRKALLNGWLHTGDLAKKDEEGYIYIVDRKKDMIIVAGLNVYPREVEEVIYQYPKVKEAAVIGMTDKLRGEYVKAFVVLKEGEECTSKELLRYMRERLAAYKLPRTIEFIPSLPKNSSGKIMKRILKEEQINK
ncbi:long-chain-fatty-acid--CoA ligase [Sinanaerobacter chloroacetimidivorans]|uniref:Long-chain fatty acid--CoA ligase n=1 Tax=Sinanaerobacter chloroacetimidivorans TaxID=2818044 RepID=A0A8J7W3E1_9FIRM|nr:long-chain fatty acid--CoA ligase [Sinanaerobacter chloroacetimidivorans]MBR0599646.1 long-chain fatty acid--CoA ligase [Sinanaerobacter chloroacetimidivorans]